MSKYASYGLGVTALSLLLSASASAATLARQYGAFGIVTYDPIPMPSAPATLARQCGAFGIVTYDLPKTQTTEVSVPYAWLTAHDPSIVDECAAYEAAAKKTAANGRMSVAACYVVGLDPESATNDFKITSFPLKPDGTPDIEHIVFDPPQERWNVSGARPVIKGASNLNGPWREVDGGGLGETALPGDCRFFKVEVVLP